MKNILIVAEQKQIKESLKAILDDKFFLFSVLNPQEALRIINEKQIDVLILDTPIKGMDVLEFIQQARSIASEIIPIVLLSTSDERTREELMENKVYEWLVKPFQRKELAYLISRANERIQLMKKIKVLENEKNQPNLESREIFTENKDFLPEEEFRRLFYYYQETFRKFSRILTHIFEPEELFGMIVTTLSEVFEVGKMAILLKEEGNSFYKIKNALRMKKDIVEDFRIKDADGIAGWLLKNGQILTKQNKLIPSYIKEEMELLEAEICIPLFDDSELLGFLSLGKKITGEDFTVGELKFLYMMSNYTALAIQNSCLYREIIQHREHLCDIMKNISSGVLTIDKEGKITSINKSAKDIFGIKDDLIGKNIQRAGSIIADIMLRTLYDEKVYNRHEVVYPGKNISLGISTVPLKDEANRIKGALMVFQNISEVKRLEKELNKTKEEEFWRELAGRMAHGVRNPLVSISTFAQLLPEKNQDKSFVKDYHETVLDSVSKLNQIVDRLEKLSDASKLNLSMENINSILEEAMGEFQEEFKKRNINLNKNIASSVPMCLLDGDKLKEAFSNLMQNSLSAMPTGGRLNVKTSYDDSKKQVQITFKDNGKGIDFEDMSKVYSPFFTTGTKGLGLGLPIVKQVVEKHGGSSNISSTPNKGTTFDVFIPIATEKEEVPIPVYQSEAVPIYSPKNLPATEKYSDGWIAPDIEREDVKKESSKSKLEGKSEQEPTDVSPPKPTDKPNEPKAIDVSSKKQLSLEEEVSSMEKKLIIDALEKTGGVKIKAAKLLNISRRMFSYKMEKLGIK
ncbi:MAG: ATP-binding protein [Candidatus Omnitrophota bacterium]